MISPTSTSTEASTDRKEVFLRSMREHGVFLIEYIRRIVKDPQIARDLAQELWADVWEAFTPDKMSNLRILCRRATQISIDHQRADGTRSFVEFTRDPPEPQDIDGAIVYAMPRTDEEIEAFKQRFWEKFPGIRVTDQQKDAFMQKEFSGYKLHEIAAHYGKPVSTVHDWVEAVKEECRRVMNNDES